MNVSDNPKLYTLRHSLAHVLAQAVQKRFANVKLGFGPPTDTGFYYDFDFADTPVTEKDLKDLEKAMKKIIGQRQEFTRSEFDAHGAIAKLKATGDEKYKIENIELLASRGEQVFSFYDNGSFTDLCEGPHVQHTGELPTNAFKLDRIAGAYWLGDEKNKMLTRIYALAYETREELDEYLKRRKMAQEFDHKKLGKELEIYSQEDIVGKGLILWHPNGTVIRDEIEAYAKEMEFKYHYKRVATPHITKAALFEKSQHIPAYLESMYPPMVLDDDGQETKYYLKPMNCPHHHLIFGSRPRSYRELPLRLAEYGTMYRYEQSGELSGLIRVRCMTINDAHIYLRPEQFEEEFKDTMKLYMEFYDTFKFKDYSFRLSTHDANSEKFKGDREMWKKGEELLAKVMDEVGVEYYVGEGEAAFYGPKIDVQFKNLMGREETVSTIQVDYLSPINFNLKYIDEQGQEQSPLIIHRSPLSTHERFVSFLLEFYGGAFPTWCAPLQVCIIPVNPECSDYVQKLHQDLHARGIRSEVDDSDNSLNKKIRTNTVRKIPNLLIIGSDEVAKNSVTLRRYGVREQQTLDREDFFQVMATEIKDRTMAREPMSSIA
jgi:threonyl-tRNA synthetase